MRRFVISRCLSTMFSRTNIAFSCNWLMSSRKSSLMSSFWLMRLLNWEVSLLISSMMSASRSTRWSMMLRNMVHPLLYCAGRAWILLCKEVKDLKGISLKVVSTSSTKMKDTGSIAISSSAGDKKLVFAKIAVSFSKNRDELSISSAVARLWISVPRKVSAARFSSPVGDRRSIHNTFSLPNLAKSVSCWLTLMSAPCL